jgi:protein-L-isoaspartate(D-aspartate) O-methyltransferase
MIAADQANQRMVDRLITEGALWSPALIDAFRQTPRHRFLHHVFVFQQRHEGWHEINTCEPGPQEIDLLYSDKALITRLGQVGGGPQVPISSSSQPSLMAEMLEDLRPASGQRVLEVGAGTGYNAALVAHVVGAGNVPGNVHSVDVDRGVLAEAAAHLAGFPQRGVQLHHGDGRSGWAEAAPFDRLMVTAATPDLEPAWLEQMTDGGVLVAPLVIAPGLAFVVRGEVRGAVFHGGLTRGAYFMPLRAEDEAPRDESGIGSVAGPWKTRPAPWAGWFDRQRPRLTWGSFLQALVFYGWLSGLDVLNRGSGSYGVQRDNAQCWFSSDDWQVNDGAASDFADALWHSWLQAGGPWPTEFRLTASAEHNWQMNWPGSYLRMGPRCHQLWRLNEVRERQGWR